MSTMDEYKRRGGVTTFTESKPYCNQFDEWSAHCIVTILGSDETEGAKAYGHKMCLLGENDKLVSDEELSRRIMDMLKASRRTIERSLKKDRVSVGRTIQEYLKV